MKREWKYRTNGEQPIHLDDDNRGRGSTDWRLIAVLAIVTANLVIGGWWGYQGWRWNRKMAVADRVIAAQVERGRLAKRNLDCVEAWKVIDRAALNVLDDSIPTSTTVEDRIRSFRETLATLIERNPDAGKP